MYRRCLDLDNAVDDGPQQADRQGLTDRDTSFLEYGQSGRMRADALDQAGHDSPVEYSHRLVELFSHLDACAGRIGLEGKPLGAEQLVESGRWDSACVDAFRLEIPAAQRSNAFRQAASSSRKCLTHKLQG